MKWGQSSEKKKKDWGPRGGRIEWLAIREKIVHFISKCHGEVPRFLSLAVEKWKNDVELGGGRFQFLGPLYQSGPERTLKKYGFFFRHLFRGIQTALLGKLGLGTKRFKDKK